MKKILMVLTAATLNCAAMAQSKMMSDCVMMKDGKMMTMVKGKTMVMKHDMTMSDGTVVMPNGMMKTKSGKKTMLKNGYCVEMSGKMEKMPMDDMHKM